MNSKICSTEKHARMRPHNTRQEMTNADMYTSLIIRVEFRSSGFLANIGRNTGWKIVSVAIGLSLKAYLAEARK